MPVSRYPRGFAAGVEIQDLPVEVTAPGQIFYVNNSAVLPVGAKAGSDSNAGTRLQPFSTIDYAIGKCTANRGDIIFVMPGHSETITAASAIDLDVAGVRLIGLGHGAKMAEIEYNHADATVAVGANDVVVENIHFNASITDVTVGVVVEDGVNDCLLRKCRFDVDIAATDDFVDAIRFTNNNKNCVVEECDIDVGLGAAVSAIHLAADTDRLVIRRNKIEGDYSTACIVGDTTLSTKIDIDSNLLINGSTGNIGTEPGIELLTGSTGIVRNNYIVCNLATKLAAVVGDTVMLFENYYNEDITGTGGLIGTASADD